MPHYAQLLTTFFAIGTIILCILLIGVLLHRFIMEEWLPKSWVPHIRAYGLWYASVLPVASFFLSLWYSEVVGLVPCSFCWFARIAMYPLALILPIAAWRKDVSVWVYTLPLSLLGVLITGYHHLLQLGLVSQRACSVSQGITCATRQVFEFGFVTLPLLGFIAFLATAVLLWIIRKVG